MEIFDESTQENTYTNNSIKKDKDTDTIYDNKKIKRRNHQEVFQIKFSVNFFDLCYILLYHI